MNRINHVNNFDLLRLLACLQVLLLHHAYLFFERGSMAHPLLRTIETLVWNFPGLNVFFIVSGYLIYGSLTNNDFKTFVKKRFLRLYPALLLCFLFTLSLLVLNNALTLPELLSLDFLKWTLAQITLFQFYNPDFVRDFGFGPPNGALWSISVEIQFYILTAFVWYFWLKRSSLKVKNIFFLFLFCLSACFNYYVNHYLNEDTLIFKLSFVSVFSYYYFFCAGIIVYLNKVWIFPLLVNKAGWWFSAFCLVSIILFHFNLHYQRYEFNVLSFAMLTLLTGLVFSLAFTKTNLANILLRKNDISYGIYIYQMPILNLMVHLNWNLTFTQFWFSFILCIFMGILSWYSIEKRFLRT